jgi:hypothetical protein
MCCWVLYPTFYHLQRTRPHLCMVRGSWDTTLLEALCAVSENGWTNNTLGLEWLKHFDRHTKASQVGAYRLLILDGHESHLNQDFKNYCLENKILTLCMPPHLSHILQPLDVVCFSPLKRKYSERVRDLARKHIFHISKKGFLQPLKTSFFMCLRRITVTRPLRLQG